MAFLVHPVATIGEVKYYTIFYEFGIVSIVFGIIANSYFDYLPIIGLNGPS